MIKIVSVFIYLEPKRWKMKTETQKYSVTFKMATGQSIAAPPSMVQRAWKPEQPIRKITGVCVCKHTKTNDYNQLQTNHIWGKSQQSKSKKIHSTFLFCYKLLCAVCGFLLSKRAIPKFSIIFWSLDMAWVSLLAQLIGFFSPFYQQTTWFQICVMDFSALQTHIAFNITK